MTLTESILQKYHSEFDKGVKHPLPAQLCTGTLEDSVLWTYMHQDLLFFNLGLNVFGQVLRLCDHPPLMIVLGKQIGFISNDENDYFTRVLKELKDAGVSGPEDLLLPRVKEYLDYLQELRESDSYVEVITAMWLFEKFYLEWPLANPIKDGLPYKYQKWIDLHAGPEFLQWVDFLASEVDRVGNANPKLVEDTFAKALDLEIAFFEDCYTYKQ